MSGERLVIEGSRWKLLLALAICAMFTALGAFMITEGEWFGWAVCGFFGLGGIAVIAVTLLRGVPRLVLDEQGFEFTAVIRRSRFAWSDVDAFYVTAISGAKMIGIEFSARYTALRSARALARFLTDGMEGAIADQFKQSPEELCALLEQWRQRHSSPRPGG
jgi:hypothetical protein